MGSSVHAVSLTEALRAARAHLECPAVARRQHYSTPGIPRILYPCLGMQPAAQDAAIAVLLLLLPLSSNIRAMKARVRIVVTRHEPAVKGGGKHEVGQDDSASGESSDLKLGSHAVAHKSSLLPRVLLPHPTKPPCEPSLICAPWGFEYCTVP